jgi:hypothetical protein
MILFQLIESHCVPILMYAIEIIHVTDVSLKRKLRVAYNSAFQRIFRYRQFESVSALRAALGRPTWEALVQSIVENFETLGTFRVRL